MDKIISKKKKKKKIKDNGQFVWVGDGLLYCGGDQEQTDELEQRGR